MIKKWAISGLIFSFLLAFNISCETDDDAGLDSVSSEEKTENNDNNEKPSQVQTGNQDSEIIIIDEGTPGDPQAADNQNNGNIENPAENGNAVSPEIVGTGAQDTEETTASNPDATPPGQPTAGYGGAANYICNDQTVDKIHWSVTSQAQGEMVIIYLPKVLKHGTSAPVVVYLHGFSAITPLLYMKHIKHLTMQGYIVIFPQFNKAYWGMLTDMDQTKMLARAIKSTNDALAKLGSKAEMNNITLYGHSVGCLLALCWSYHPEAPGPKNIVLAEPQVDLSQGGIPAVIEPLVVGMVTAIDWKMEIKATTCPVILLTGNQDWIAAPAMAVDIYNELTNASSKVVYLATSDRYGHPTLVADHMSPVCLEGTLEDIIANYGAVDPYVQWFWGNTLALDAMDYRFFWAACDAALDGKTSLAFNLGSWSDGTPVTPITQLAP